MSDSPTSTDSEEMHEFSISTILPGFLFLGPEITAPEHVDQLRAVGVKRILNVAIECDPDDSGLGLRDRFDRYLKIPMRDIVEEENVAKCVKEVCEFLDDARLHSSPTYVHCKAGKSRSVTAVIAYLIHANHWPLSRAYAFVLDRRKGICPNIGFVSELMTFEEQKLGGKSLLPHSKSTSAIPTPVAGAATPPGAPGYTSTLGGRRPSHIRESLPPMLPGHQHVPLEGHDADDVALGSAQEVEVRDSSGRYRHARRAPVDEETLQPMRRVSKAGLESSSWL
ncbi:hypothetical protein BOTBODRAFT_114738 [Botryobasidium botryosum FD-172 SS1]|uniref:protein-tyrosine-phosphatase n=1 Tax=Botryobasidium botryosum (strain FD-172 SS1) TaxID=930990 RepID=A0A067M631_BOTB1|nr:hypothetical protein BOTBODRAFT_114738 [Botryobasidium botryosum FD-172 SS1]